MQAIEQNRHAVIHRFVVACQADERVEAAFLGGSYARDATDAYSDIDFGLITTLDTKRILTEQYSLGPKLLKPNRSRRYVASSPGSGMKSATTSSRLWHVGSCGRRTAVYRIYASLV